MDQLAGLSGAAAAALEGDAGGRASHPAGPVSQTSIRPDAAWVPDHGSSLTLVVLPTYNERENLERAVRAVREVGYDVLVVDDSSPDGTGELAERMARSDPGVHGMVRPGKARLGAAYVEGVRCGLERGHRDLVEMAAGRSHPPGDLGDI